MKIYAVTDPEFSEYGQVVTGYDPHPLIQVMEETPCPEGKTVYVPSEPRMEALPIAKALSDRFYGYMPVQLGYCNGHNTKLNALEYHRDSEINLPAGNDIILLLAKRSDLDKAYHMNTDAVKAFRVPAGTFVEIYASTLHYAPCEENMEKGFRVVVVLPRGTNYPLPESGAASSQIASNVEEQCLAATNKWLIGHPEGGCKEGTYLGLEGINLDMAGD